MELERPVEVHAQLHAEVSIWSVGGEVRDGYSIDFEQISEPPFYGSIFHCCFSYHTSVFVIVTDACNRAFSVISLEV